MPDQTGELYLADISVPPDIYRSLALSLEVCALFAQSDSETRFVIV